MTLKSAVWLLVLAAVTAGVPCLDRLWAAAEKIEWHSYEAGMARSRFEKKKVFIYFYAEWCTYCADMDRKTFTNPEVVGMLNRNFIPIRVDADRDKAAASLYRVTGLPDIWFLAETGEVIGHRPGFIPADQMLKVLGAALAGPVK
jgi:thioredoxin-related protein